MRTITIQLLLLLAITTASFAQEPQYFKVDKIGLVGEMAYVRGYAEDKAISILNDSTLTDKSKVEFSTRYNILRTVTDQVLLQLAADLKNQNALRRYRLLDGLLKDVSVASADCSNGKGKKAKGYCGGLSAINGAFAQVEAYSPKKKVVGSVEVSVESFFPASASLEELTGVLNFVGTTIKDAREAREKKVDKVAALLLELRLKPLQEITGGPKKEEKSDDKKDGK
jgi:hypothetical protein